MRLIDADELKKTINEVYEYEYPASSGGFDEFVTKVLPNIISNAPTIEAEPVKHAHWEKAQPRGYTAYSDAYKQCSFCKEVQYKAEEMKYCPNCGARCDGCGNELNETVDEPKAEIVVPEKMTYEEADSTYRISYVINEIIECLEQIKERIDD